MKYLLLAAAFFCVANAKAQQDTTSQAYQLAVDTTQYIDFTKRTAAAVENTFRVTDRFANGQVASRVFTNTLPKTIDFQKEGQAIIYYSSGQVRQRAIYQNNLPIGRIRTFYKNGQLYKEEKVRYDSTGTAFLEVLSVRLPSGELIVKEGNGLSREYDPEETFTLTGRYRNGLRDSVWIATLPNGKVYFEEQYLQGKLVSGYSVDLMGAEYSYTKQHEPPVYKEGEKTLAQLLVSRDMGMDKGLWQATTGFDIWYNFYVDATGHLQKVVAENPVGLDLRKIEEQIYKLTKDRWLPGKKRGQVAAGVFSMKLRVGLSTSTHTTINRR